MKYRSPAKIFAYFYLSLGLYGLYWFSRTREELTNKGARIPGMALFSIAYMARLLAMAALIYLVAVWFVVPQEPKTTVSQACWQEFVIGSASETKLNNPISAQCHEELAAADRSTAQVDREQAAMFIALGGAIFYLLASTKWLIAYSRGVETATRSAISGTSIAWILVTLPPGADIMLIQERFNAHTR